MTFGLVTYSYGDQWKNTLLDNLNFIRKFLNRNKERRCKKTNKNLLSSLVVNNKKAQI